MKIFLDTNVLFSAIMSDKGAAFALISLIKKGKICGITSDICLKELKRIEDKLKFKVNVDQFLKSFNIKILKLKEIKPKFEVSFYVKDQDDAHVIQGAIESESEYLVTFNMKDFYADVIYNAFHIKVLTQGMMLQTLRQIGVYE